MLALNAHCIALSPLGACGQVPSVRRGIPSHDLVMEGGCPSMFHLSGNLDASTSLAGHVPSSQAVSLPQKDLSCLPGVGS